MPRYESVPVRFYPCRPLPKLLRCVELEENPRRIRFAPQRISGAKAIAAKPVQPMLDFGVMAAGASGLVMVDDQAPIRPRKFTQLTQQDAFTGLGGAVHEASRL